MSQHPPGSIVTLAWMRSLTGVWDAFRFGPNSPARAALV